MHLLVGFPNPWPAAFRKFAQGVFSFIFLLKFLSKNLRFGRSLAQLILDALSIYPFEVKEGSERRFLSDVPFGRFCLPSRFGQDSCLLGPSGLEYGLLGWIWGLPSCNFVSWPLALKSELLLLPGALCVLLYGGGLSAYQPRYPSRPSSHKYGFFSRAP